MLKGNGPYDLDYEETSQPFMFNISSHSDSNKNSKRTY